MSVVQEWVPKTLTGKLVKEGRITSVNQIFEQNLPIREVEIVDALLPSLKHEIVSINLVQRQTDAGEVGQFQATVVVGNEDGYVGIGMGKSRQVRMAIEKAIVHAKLNLIPVKRGCGSWSCLCGEEHSLPFKVRGKVGSVEVVLLPAPRGLGIVASETAKVVLRLAGIQDVWTRTKGETRTPHNVAKVVYEALKQTYAFSV
ncbi:MAG: 30S ribosomal protein S5 [Thermofilaceae archaeon]|nr:30S ribosomal protein S5 [Thermofilaceae archaeon]MCX8180633.1 30S ribosomal protein S5 [Thermofilaceae archaeon]MDW8003735.1 30S ribosomal protein S5 [Thermofilaceae archaeon]